MRRVWDQVVAQILDQDVVLATEFDCPEIELPVSGDVR
jgi:hypothetical protein